EGRRQPRRAQHEHAAREGVAIGDVDLAAVRADRHRGGREAEERAAAEYPGRRHDVGAEATRARRGLGTELELDAAAPRADGHARHDARAVVAEGALRHAVEAEARGAGERVAAQRDERAGHGRRRRDAADTWLAELRDALAGERSLAARGRVRPVAGRIAGRGVDRGERPVDRAAGRPRYRAVEGRPAPGIALHRTIHAVD